MIDETRLKGSFEKIKDDILYLQQELIILKQEIQEIRQILESSTRQTTVRHSAHNPADNLPRYSLNKPNFHSSIGNDGVPTDSQQIHNRQILEPKRTNYEQEQFRQDPLISMEISSIIDTLKTDLKDKFKRLTKQEFLIFSILYTLEEELDFVTYKDLAQRTGLTESSCRDYISRLEHKGIPVIKEKLNNKLIILKLPRELKDIATLDSLSRLKKL